MKLPLTYRSNQVFDLPAVIDADRKGVDAQIHEVFPGDPIRSTDIASIRVWLEAQQHHLTGRVLDYGCGKSGTCRKPQPYRDLASGEYVGIDKGDALPPGYFDAVICTQVIQYLNCPRQTMGLLLQFLRPGGHLLLTGPSSWAEAEVEDFRRYTRSGIRKLVVDAGFDVVSCDERAAVQVGSFRFSLGWGLVGVRR